MHAWQLDAIGTAWQIDTAEPLAQPVVDDVLACMERFDRAWSRFRADSLVTEISRRPGRWRMPEEAEPLLGLLTELHDATQGAVNPLVGQTLADLGYDVDYSLVASPTPGAVPAWDTVTWQPPTLTTSAPVLIDVGAAGKGLLVDLVSGILRAHVHDFTVDASGDIFHGGTAPIRVALEDPRDPTRALGVAELDPEVALCASATNRRAWGEGLHHVIDARTGRPTDDVIATWVVASSCLSADGLATAHFFADPEVLVGRFPHEFVRLHAGGRVEWSSQFPGEVFT